jgi:ABC-type sugar transport system ATPase subunit
VSPKSASVVPRLAARGVSKTYGRVRALDDVSFEPRGGEVMALLGQNGAGKSTLVKILSGLVQPGRGGGVKRCKEIPRRLVHPA